MFDRTTKFTQRPDATAGTPAVSPVTIRPAGEADREALLRLAILDSASVPVGDLLVADIDGRLVAAVAVLSRKAIADPFHPTAELVSLLRTRAGQLVAAQRAASEGRGRVVLRRLRLAD